MKKIPFLILSLFLLVPLVSKPTSAQITGVFTCKYENNECVIGQDGCTVFYKTNIRQCANFGTDPVGCNKAEFRCVSTTETDGNGKETKNGSDEIDFDKITTEGFKGNSFKFADGTVGGIVSALLPYLFAIA